MDGLYRKSPPKSEPPKEAGFTRPLYVDSRFLRPLPQSMWDVACSKCDKRQSRWDFRPTDNPPPSGGFPLCSLCWLYESEWGKERWEEVGSMLREIEKVRGKVFMRAENDRLWACKDADPILGSIVMTSRMFELQAREADDGG